MDALSQVLSTIDLTGSLYFPALLHAKWGLHVPANSNACRFHVVVEGTCWLSTGSETIRLHRGDLALVPHGRAHDLKDDPKSPLVNLDEAVEETQYPGTGLFEWGETGSPCRLVCGHFTFDERATHPLVGALPTFVHLRATSRGDFRWVDEVIRFMGEEMHSQRPGSQLIGQRLSEVLFVQFIRHYSEQNRCPVPVLAALTDPNLNRALFAMHTEPEREWLVKDLATLATMSRTTFALRFAELLGSTPMRYLLSQRMNLAAKLLRAGARSAEVAGRVGYRSEAAFARKFKATHGISPGAYRRSAVQRFPPGLRTRLREARGTMCHPSSAPLDSLSFEAFSKSVAYAIKHHP